MAELLDGPADIADLFKAHCADCCAPLSGDPDFYIQSLHIPLGRFCGKTWIAASDTGTEHARRLRAQYGAVRIVAVPAKHILAAIERVFRRQLLERAVHGLAEHEPQLSASRVITRGQGGAFIAIAAALSISFFLMPRLAGLLLIVLSGIAFCMNAMFRAALLWVGADEKPITPEPPAIADDDLPIYSILVPLYHEANVLPALLRALRALDYPGIR